MKAILLAILRVIFGPKLMAALQGGQAAYQAEAQKEQAAAVEAKIAEVQQVQAEVEVREEQAHAEVASAADPDVVVNEQLRGLGLVADDERSAGGDACATNASAPADRKDQGG